MITKPMLAETCEDVAKLKFPVLVTPKLDGIRCLVVGGKALSRKFKPIPNRYIREKIESIGIDGLDGEIMVTGLDFNGVQSAVMSEGGEPDFEYVIFDYVSQGLEIGYQRRLVLLQQLHIDGRLPGFCTPLIPQFVNTVDQLWAIEESVVAAKFEGLMIRQPEGPYKCGRSTVREGYLLKLKRFVDSEAEVLTIIEEMRNDNPAEKDELGHTKRSSKKANLVPAGTMGALSVKDLKDGRRFAVGTGFTDAQRQEIWDKREKYIGKIVTYKYQPGPSIDGLPRFPTFKGFRDPRDMS